MGRVMSRVGRQGGAAASGLAARGKGAMSGQHFGEELELYVFLSCRLCDDGSNLFEVLALNVIHGTSWATLSALGTT